MQKVLCSGTFDILHKGHKEFLKDIKKQGDYLIALVISDKLVYENKRKYPKNTQDKRAQKLKKLKIADKIIGTSDNINLNFGLIKKINPEIIAIGYDQKTKVIQKLKKFLKKEGLKPKYYVSEEFAKGIHSSHLNK